MVFGLFVLNRVYNLTRVCPKQGLVPFNSALVVTSLVVISIHVFFHAKAKLFILFFKGRVCHFLKLR